MALLPLSDDRLGDGDLGLDLARLAGSENRVHPGSDGGEHPVELELEPLAVSPGPEYFSRFRLP